MKIKYLIILIAAVIVTFEILLRLSSPDILSMNKIIKVSNDEILGFELIPGAKIKFVGTSCKIPETTIEISAQGLRDRSFDIKKTNVKRIAFLGDSYVFGSGVEEKDSIPKQLERILNEKSTIRYEVMNCGVVGYNLQQEVEFMKQRVLAFNPDIIIFLITNNDINTQIQFPKNKLSKLIFSCSYLFRHIYPIVNAYREKRDGEGKNLQHRLRETTASFKSITASLKQEQKVILVVRNFSPWMQAILDVCTKEGFPALDFSPFFRRFKDRIIISSCDGHFNPIGTMLIAQKIGALLKEKTQ